MEFIHKSVLLEESINWLITDKDGIYVDCTMGGAGHSKGFAMQLSSRGTLVAIDQDDDAIAAASVRLQGLPCKIKIAKSNFKNFDDVLDGLDIDKIDGIFFDLGVSSYQLDTPERGFSYMHDGPLDMRMDKESKKDAYYIVNRYKEEELADLQAKAQSATASQMSSLSDANKSMEEAAKADNRTDAAETKKDQTQKAENTQENADTATDASENADVKTETAETIKNPASESGQSVVYTPIDIRL